MRHLIAFAFGDRRFARMASVLEASARQHCPVWNVEVCRVTERPRNSFDANAIKQRLWRDVVNSLADGEDVLLLDADMVVLRSLDDLWTGSWDVAITERPAGARLPFNLGFVAVRVSQQTRDLMEQWSRETDILLGDRWLLTRWAPDYGGIAQSAWGAMESRGALERYRVHRLPCEEWNSVDETWDTALERARILHVKAWLRQQVFGDRPGPHVALVDLWHHLERGDGHGTAQVGEYQAAR